MKEDWQNAGFGLYLHWPFCLAKCPYCDFNSHVSKTVDDDAWEHAFLSEIDRLGRETPGRVLNSIFFGGGTPSLMPVRLVDRILTRIRETWHLSNDCEITLEANPTSIEADKFRGFRDAGVNRVSVGIQALNNDDLRRLGRMHSVSEAMAALDIARETFSRVSFDLIYARQDQTLSAWQSELKQALDLEPDHLSLYQLTIEDGTAFGDRFAKGGLRGLPSEDLSADMYFATQEICDHKGLPAYEVSNHARPGAESRHNMIYWNYGDYAGIGPGAHGRLTLNGEKYATETHLMPKSWLSSVSQNQTGESLREKISLQDQYVERLLMGLRLSDGVELRRLSSSSDLLVSPQVTELRENGLIFTDENRIRVTPTGRPLLNAILRKLLEA
ncbi:radical SAM family heme chaperone HemW [Halocynthiibacter namhaensis]|uniref:radical SAM family heme chaperone HemW n=1 Tax=Halocynthiibacter namhaensis TaxID=1290553 RepID=UPI000578F042|nr:radical SAM family heme chaperone HemW [Halocynthiibacter namhaensis]